jgi:hypothetical protein
MKYHKVKINKADRWFSIFIRIRDSNHLGFGKCVTCGKLFHWKELQCGHYMKRARPLTRYHEKNCHSQCRNCNCFKEGEQGKHGLAIDSKYGANTAQMLADLHDLPGQKKYTKNEIDEIAKKYKKKAKELATKKGIEL